MRRLMLMALGGALVFTGSTMHAANSYANDEAYTDDISVCYKVVYKSSGGSDSSWYEEGWHDEYDRRERLNLNIKFHSYLYGGYWEGDDQGQPVYSVHGKYTFARRGGSSSYKWDMTTADGTLITNSDRDDYTEDGARLGISTHGVLRGAYNITFDCTSPDHDPHYIETLYCKVRQDGGRVQTAHLEKVDNDDWCDVFRDSRGGY